MKKIEVAVLNEAHSNPEGMMMFLAKLTQRGHNIKSMDDLMKLYSNSVYVKQNPKVIRAVTQLPHGTIKRFAPITIAIVGASRRFLAQARTNQVGLDYVSGSLQYSDYSDEGQFVVPYAITAADYEETLEAHACSMAHKALSKDFEYDRITNTYLSNCQDAMCQYADMVKEGLDNDTAGYIAPQALRNVLIMQGNHQSWDYFIRLRSCSRNTAETQYVTMLIWDALLKTQGGKELFEFAGPDCLHGSCREGKMTCGEPLMTHTASMSVPMDLASQRWPLLFKEDKL